MANQKETGAYPRTSGRRGEAEVSNNSGDESFFGFMTALLVVFVFGVTVVVSRCTMVGSIATDCDDFGKFESNGYGKPWYECKKQVPQSSASTPSLER